VRQHMADVEVLIPVVDLCNQPLLVAFDVEHSPFVHRVGVRERFSHIHQILPRCLLRNSEPRIQRRFQFGMPPCRFFKPLAADYVHSGLEGEVRNLRHHMLRRVQILSTVHVDGEASSQTIGGLDHQSVYEDVASDVVLFASSLCVAKWQ
jgi:hypothetical protein